MKEINRHQFHRNKSLNFFNTNIFGGQNVVATGSQIEQQVGNLVSVGDVSSLRKALEDYGIPKKDVSELEKALAQDGNRSSAEGFGKKTKAWIGNTLKKVATGSINIAIEIAARILPKLISEYYGWK